MAKDYNGGPLVAIKTFLNENEHFIIDPLHLGFLFFYPSIDCLVFLLDQLIQIVNLVLNTKKTAKNNNRPP
ncbi:hypothetical protein SPSIL_050810 [Sporomusa silvacetica DSM 10669]|uniref:Uncharacterized protein n=1 Tax=Sporomusa silvacetica DSM 10669 TaxID=1123289 RepID=A0ABZ3IT44_9FIRM|nr:hypothetical protein SPSIL_36930 [Sporomusa silvacetica DSM 10669]